MATLYIPIQQRAFFFGQKSTKHRNISTSTLQDLNLSTQIRCSSSRDSSNKCVESLSQFKELRNVACGFLAVWAVSAVSPVIAANQRLPPLSTEPNRCERAFVGNTIGQANGVYDKPLDLRFCDYTNEKTNLKGKSLAAALMSEAKFDGADMTEVVMSKAYAVGASFKGTDFSNAVLDRVNFGKANLQGAVFKNTVLSGSTFDDAQLQDVDFEDTIIGVEGQIGVNYGTVADNLPPPPQVARFLAGSTTINRVRIFDCNPRMLKAFANTNIAVTVTIPNDLILNLTNLNFARQWVQTNVVVPQSHATNIIRILVGNEVLSTANKLLIANLVPAMQSLQNALVEETLDGRIKISTPHSLGILSSSTPPSTGKFRNGYDYYILKPLLEFLKATNSPFMINPYPFFACSDEMLDYALFRPNRGLFDENTKITYDNMLDGQLDAVFSAMRRLGFNDVDIVIAETGWPTRGDVGQTGVDAECAAEYNRKLVQHVTSGIGTPLMPNRTFETYIFALFDEDLKPGPTCERNFGLFRPDFTPAYDIGILKSVGDDNGAEKIERACLLMILLHFLGGL
ncbi:glucan endo-1 3-beta-glucosidase [Phtheirospermum japonicum]|uniref:glucan endo-1,3-beta-D-glucosidase n=1 Tax=Phtheirospermum japonicum TaxID=374723 RepID=A0A830CH52_9LAMI|nr:glucan endo-1 3-beta-glucosidase [Phtheirospermum japonicum]